MNQLVLNLDETIERVEGHHPLYSQDIRTVILHLGSGDKIIIKANPLKEHNG